jgi:hypothetical protein
MYKSSYNVSNISYLNSALHHSLFVLFSNTFFKASTTGRKKAFWQHRAASAYTSPCTPGVVRMSPISCIWKQPKPSSPGTKDSLLS